MSINKLGEITVCYGEGSKHVYKSFDKILGIGVPYFLMDLLPCCGFLKNIHYIVILKGPKNMLEYYFSKGFTILECNDNNLAKLLNDVKKSCRSNR